MLHSSWVSVRRVVLIALLPVALGVIPLSEGMYGWLPNPSQGLVYYSLYIHYDAERDKILFLKQESADPFAIPIGEVEHSVSSFMDPASDLMARLGLRSWWREVRHRTVFRSLDSSFWSVPFGEAIPEQQWKKYRKNLAAALQRHFGDSEYAEGVSDAVASGVVVVRDRVWWYAFVAVVRVVLMFVFLGIAIAIVVPSRRERAAARIARGCCAACGYSLAGVDGACPECGTARHS